MLEVLLNGFVLVSNPPVWETVKHTLQHNSGLAQTITFKEKRSAFTKKLRRAISFDIESRNTQQIPELIETLRAAMMASKVAVPLWGRGGRITNIAGGVLTVTTKWNFKAGDYVVIYGSPGQVVSNQIISVTPTTITLASDPTTVVKRPDQIIPILYGVPSDRIAIKNDGGRNATFTLGVNETFQPSGALAWNQAFPLRGTYLRFFVNQNTVNYGYTSAFVTDAYLAVLDILAMEVYAGDTSLAEQFTYFVDGLAGYGTFSGTDTTYLGYFATNQNELYGSPTFLGGGLPEASKRYCDIFFCSGTVNALPDPGGGEDGYYATPRSTTPYSEPNASYRRDLAAYVAEYGRRDLSYGTVVSFRPDLDNDIDAPYYPNYLDFRGQIIDAFTNANDTANIVPFNYSDMLPRLQDVGLSCVYDVPEYTSVDDLTALVFSILDNCGLL